MKDILKEHYKKIGSKGGKASMAKLTPEERSKKARDASNARWKKLSTGKSEDTGQAE